MSLNSKEIQQIKALVGRVSELESRVEDLENTLNFSGSQTYSITGLTVDRVFDADTIAAAEIADVLGTLITDLRKKDLVK